jgi:hypothetical protein
MCLRCILLFSAVPRSHTVTVSDFLGLVNKLLNEKLIIASKNFDDQERTGVQSLWPPNMALIEHGAGSGRLFLLFNSAPRG